MPLAREPISGSHADWEDEVRTRSIDHVAMHALSTLGLRGASWPTQTGFPLGLGPSTWFCAAKPMRAWTGFAASGMEVREDLRFC